MSKLNQAGDAEGAEKLFNERFEPTSRAYLAGVQQMVDAQRAELDAAGKRSEDLRAQTSLLLTICTGFSLLLGALLAWLLANSITRPCVRPKPLPRPLPTWTSRVRPKPVMRLMKPAVCCVRWM